MFAGKGEEKRNETRGGGGLGDRRWERKDQKKKKKIEVLILKFVLSSNCLPTTRNEDGKLIEANTILCSFVETGRS